MDEPRRAARKPPPQRPVPAVFVLWHPRCRVGRELAKDLYAWMRPVYGVGPDIGYRSTPDPAATDRLPPPLPIDPRQPGEGFESDPRNDYQAILALVDANMVTDPAWRGWLAGLAKPPRAASLLLPVALDGTAYNMPPEMRALNFVRPAGLPGSDAEPHPGWLDEAKRSLRKLATEALARHFLPRPAEGPADAPPKVTLFLSYARRDGAEPARRLRDYIDTATQLGVFYDENDIAYGSPFAEVLEDSLDDSSTAALIAVRTAVYTTRAWCRREFFSFRAPLEALTRAARTELWQLRPTLVVEAMAGGTTSPGLAEAGNSTVVRWDASFPGIEELIVTTVLRDAMLRAYHGAVAARLARDLPPPPPGVRRVFLNWLPDVPSLARVAPLRAERGQVEVVYPGRGLPSQDIAMLQEQFPRARFRAFEALRAGSAAAAPSSSAARYRTAAQSADVPRVVGLSVSADAADLLALGLGDEHLRDFLVRVGRPLLRHGAHLAYGGHWLETETEENNFTQDLLRLVQAEREDLDADEKGGGALGRLFSLAPWPYHLEITSRMEADAVNACKIVRVTQELAGLRHACDRREPRDEQDWRPGFNKAATLSAMRRLQHPRFEAEDGPLAGLRRALRLVHRADDKDPPPPLVPPLSARLLLGGRLRGYEGFVPGVFEEFVRGVAAEGCAMFLLGGFGGAACVLAEAVLAKPGSARPKELTIGWHRVRNARLALLDPPRDSRPFPALCPPPAELLDAVFAAVEAARADAEGTLACGLAGDELRELLTTSDTATAARLVQRGFESRFGLPPLLL